MAIGALVSNGVVVNMMFFEDTEDVKDVMASTDFGPDTSVIYVPEDVFVSIGYVYKDGEFGPAPVPEPTYDELLMMARNEQYNRMYSVQTKFSSPPIIFMIAKEAIGESSEEQKAFIKSIISYYQELKSVDILTDPGNIDWPEMPEIIY